MTPPAIRLDDLAEPVWPPEIAEMIAAVAPLGDEVELSAEAIVTQARAETGLEDLGPEFGPTTAVERLQFFCECLAEAGLWSFGRFSVHTMLVGLTKNRLWLADLLTRHPEIRDVEITRPIVIVGQPRTGTTHLHNLLSADPGLRSLPYWESMQPVPTPGEPTTADASDPRWQRTEMGVGFTNAAMPEFKRMHEMTVDHVHEEIQLLAMDYSTMLFDSMVPMPRWRDHYRATDQTPSYEYMKLCLQAMQYLRGGERWVLKSPQHIEQLRPLRNVFPDATVLLTHRDPVAVTLSMVTMLSYTARLQVGHPNPAHIASYWVELMDQMLHAVVRDRELVGDNGMDVVFGEFMADDLAMVERIYACAGQPLDERARAAHRDYLAHHQRDRFGKVTYDPTQFNLDLSALRRRFAFYSEAFGIPHEYDV